MNTTTNCDTDSNDDARAAVHAAYVDALPGYLDGSLSDDESARLRAHLEGCAACRAELALTRRIREYMQREWRTDGRTIAPLLEPAHEAAQFDALWSRIAHVAPSRTTRRHSPLRRWTASLTSLAATLLAASGIAWYLSAGAPAYTTLAEPPQHACGSVRVRIVAPPPAARAALEATGARVVDGPTADGLYTLDAADPAAVIAALRARPDVRFAEPTDC